MIKDNKQKSKTNSILKAIVVSPIIFYQYIISPTYSNCCRFEPTCSEYSKNAIRKYGVIKGMKMTIKRLLNCHPWGKSGFDPV